MAVNIKYGFKSTVVNSATSLNSQTPLGGVTGLSSYRVKDIILDNTHPRFKEFGEWNGIGTIFITPVNGDTSVEDSLSIYELAPAFPLFPNIKQYPLKEEIVPVAQLSDVGSQTNVFNTVNYYLPPINIWNSQTHNAIPSPQQIEAESNKPPTSQDYIAAESGSLRRVIDSDTGINLGNTFDESTAINNHPLLPFEGDIIYEGRFGNSIRLSSTIRGYNNWSGTGTNGSPIIILRNGQGTDSVDSSDLSAPWIPTVENINKDKSSIYLTSNQQINLIPTSYFATSYQKSSPPPTPQQYDGSQIILNSGRLFFNSKDDSIILISKNSVGIKANTSINLESSTEIEISSPKVYLGSAQGIEGINIQSVVLGENLIDNLKNLITTLNILSKSLTNSSVSIIDPLTKQSISYPIPSLNTIGPILSSTCDDIISNINLGTKPGGILSDIVKTK
jgi:hypothetical protein